MAKTAFIPFHECIMEGSYREIKEGLGDLSNAGWKRYLAVGSAEIRLMTVNGIRKYIVIENGATFGIGYNMLMYSPDNVTAEHEVDEKKWRKDNHPKE